MKFSLEQFNYLVFGIEYMLYFGFDFEKNKDFNYFKIKEFFFYFYIV